MADDFREGYRRVRFRCVEQNLPASFAIVTACNPDGQVADDAANRDATARLGVELDRLGYRSFPVTGGNSDFSHAEPGFGIVCPRNVALNLARQFRQEAIFQVKNGDVLLVSALAKGPTDERVGTWSTLLSD